jgi:hypothetical protein
MCDCLTHCALGLNPARSLSQIQIPFNPFAVKTFYLGGCLVVVGVCVGV